MCTRRSLRRRSLDLGCCDVAIETLVRLTHANALLFGRELVAAKGLARQASAHSTQKAGDSSPTPRLVAPTTRMKRISLVGVVLGQYLRPIRIRSFLTRAQYDHRYRNIVLGSIAAETRCGSEETRRYILNVSSSRSWNGGGSTSSAAESPPAQHDGLGCMHRRETWMPDV